MKKIFIALVVLLFFGFSISSVLAQKTAQKVIKEEKTISSFEIFWPLVAGKVKGDKFYSLKTLKENLRGSLIFGKAQKADYQLFLTTKRILEVEKLSKEGKKEYALETLDQVLSNLDEVSENIDKAGDSIKLTTDGLNLKFDNLETFLPWLVSQFKDKELKDKTQLVLDKVNNLHKKI